MLKSATTSRPIFGVVFDEQHPRLYVGITDEEGRPAVRAYHRDTMELLGEMRVPEGELTCGLLKDCFGGLLATQGNERFVFYGWNGPTRALRFVLPPP